MNDGISTSEDSSIERNHQQQQKCKFSGRFFWLIFLPRFLSRNKISHTENTNKRDDLTHLNEDSLTPQPVFIAFRSDVMELITSNDFQRCSPGLALI